MKHHPVDPIAAFQNYASRVLHCTPFIRGLPAPWHDDIDIAFKTTLEGSFALSPYLEKSFHQKMSVTGGYVYVEGNSYNEKLPRCMVGREGEHAFIAANIDTFHRG